jgi:hypothetical protein
MVKPSLDAAKTALALAVQNAIPAIRQQRAAQQGQDVPAAEAAVQDTLLQLFGALHEAGALRQTSSNRNVTELYVSNGELGELVLDFRSNEKVVLRRRGGEPAEAVIPDAGGSSLLLLASADRLAREISAGNLHHDSVELNDAIRWLNEQGQQLLAERH